MGLDLAALLLPDTEQCGLIVSHDNARIRAANEAASGRFFPPVGFHVFLTLLENRFAASKQLAWSSSTRMVADQASASGSCHSRSGKNWRRRDLRNEPDFPATTEHN